MYEYMLLTEASIESIAVSNGLYATMVSVIE